MTAEPLQRPEESLRRDFYKRMLKPREGEPDTYWIIMTQARRKYFPELTQSNACIGREVLHAENLTEDKFIAKLELVEFRAARARERKTNKSIPREAIVLYISANTCDGTKAFFVQFQEMTRQIQQMAQSSVKSNANGIPQGERAGSTTNMIGSYKTCLAKSSRKEYIKLDVDTKDKDAIAQLQSLLRDNSIMVRHAFETRGGYHVLIPCTGQDLRHLYDFSRSLGTELGKQNTWLTIENASGGPFLAIPGTYQSTNWLVKPAHDSWCLTEQAERCEQK